MRSFFLIFLFCTSYINAQDKLFFKDGTSRKGVLVTNAKDYVYFKSSDTSALEKIQKSKLILMEDYKGTRYLFSGKENNRDSLPLALKKSDAPRNIFSIQPLAVLFGRGSFYYERISKDQKVGIVIPLILTFDPQFGNAFNSLLDSTRNSRRVKGINYITGFDLNFYFGKKEGIKLFMGPRLRYGTDVAFLNIEGYSLQTQFGIRVGRPDKKTVQHLAVGFGFVRIISSSALRIVDPKLAHPWYSLNYRLGVKW